MKIEISKEVIEEIANTIATDARKAITGKILQLEDKELIGQIRVGQGTNYQKLVAYFNHTKLNRYNYGGRPVIIVGSSDVAKAFGLHVLAMKAVRDELVRRGLAEVYRENDKLHLRYFLPAPAAAAPGTEAKQ